MDAAIATDVARQYLRPFAYFKPLSGKKQGKHWLVTADVGLLRPKVLELEISEAGEVLRAR